MLKVEFDDLVLKGKDLDLSEYEANFIVGSSYSKETQAGTLQVTMTASFRPHMQAKTLAFSDFEFEQYVWQRITDHTDAFIRISPVKIIPLRFRTEDIEKKQAEHFKKSILPTLPDYTKKENRKIHILPDLDQVRD